MAAICLCQKVQDCDANHLEKKQPQFGANVCFGPKPSHRDVGTRGKRANYSKKPTHKDVDAPGNLQAAHDTGYESLAEPTCSRKKTGASTLTLL